MNGLKANLFLWFIILMGIGSCINRLEFDVGGLDNGILVFDGQITDKPGPYTIKLLRASNIDDPLNFATPFVVKQVTITDNAGNAEVLTSEGAGIYKTRADGIQGVIGREYRIKIELLNGSSLVSEPDRLLEAGSIDSLFYEWTSQTSLTAPTQYGFRVFINSSEPVASGVTENYMRWRFTGTYKVLTYPELHLINDVCLGPADPLPCSGYVIEGGVLKNVDECTCCYCWVSAPESKPHVNDEQITTNGTFRNMEIGYIPFDEWTFSQNKYMVKVELMSLTKSAFEFWKVIKDQKEGLTSLFQPAFGKTRTNLFSTDPRVSAVGIFYASSIKQKILFINSADAPISVPVPVVFPRDACALWDQCDDVFYHASRTPPPEWE